MIRHVIVFIFIFCIAYQLSSNYAQLASEHPKNVF